MKNPTLLSGLLHLSLMVSVALFSTTAEGSFAEKYLSDIING